MLEYQVEPNDKIVIRWQGVSTDTSLYPQAKIYDENDALYATVNLIHRQSGLYTVEWTAPSIKGKYYTQIIIYTDAGYTTEHPAYRPDSDSINVGRYSTGGVFGGSNKVLRTSLTDEELKRIIDGLLSVLKPDIDSIAKDVSEIKKMETLEKIEEKMDKMDVKPEVMGMKDCIDAMTSELGLIKESNTSIANMQDVLAKEKLDSIKNTEKVKKVLDEFISKSVDLKDGFNRAKIDLEKLKEVRDISEDTSKNSNSLLKVSNDFSFSLNEFKKLFEELPIKNEETYSRVLNMISASSMMDEIGKDIDGGINVSSLYLKIKNLPKKDKDEILRIIAKRNPKMISELLKLSQ